MIDPTAVKETLERMRVADPEFRVFGAMLHQYSLGPTVPEAELRKFEETYQIRLPEDYRNFLKYVGNGNRIHSENRVRGLNAAGPYYGLIALAEAHFDCLPQERFPLTLDEGGDPGGADIFKDVDADFAGDLEFPGMIQICHQGCAGYFNLVVNGGSYGAVWETWEYQLFARGWTFEQWYSHWLEQLVVTAIPKLEREERVKEIQLGMSKDEVVARCGGEWTQRESTYPTSYHSTLASPDFASQFNLDKDNRVARIVKHHIYFR